MIEFLRTTLTNQFDASLCMLNEGIQICPSEHWLGIITADTFQQVAYHTLFFVDMYLSPGEDAFKLRGLHAIGGDERQPVVSAGLPKDDTLAYLAMCRQKAAETLASETEASLQGPSGFSYRKMPRYELHLCNIRHIQHHTAQMSAYLRRVAGMAIPWIASGWCD